MIVETQRLLLKPAKLSDVPTLFEFLGDPEAMRFTHVDQSLKECRRRVAVHEWLRRRNHYAPWTITIRDTGEVIGWGGLYDDPFDPGWGVEVGYYFRPLSWGKGYASELVAAALDVADRSLMLPLVTAFARPSNEGSCRVLEKSGFVVERYLPDIDRNLYRRARKAHP